MQFQEILGLDGTKNKILQSAKSGNVAHAQLFSGKPGGAALPMALAYASYLLCPNKAEDSCGTCPTCEKTKKFIHPDVHFVFPVSSTKKITGTNVISKSFMDSWRAFLSQHPYGDILDWTDFYGGENKQALISKQESREIIKDLALMSFEGGLKVTIVWMPELMHSSAANGILKILEEPPENTVFLLVTYNIDQIISTIISRVQTINIPPFRHEELVGILVERGIAESRAQQLAQLSDGSVGTALKLNENLQDDNGKMFQSWMRTCFQRNYPEIINWSEEFGRMGKVAQKSLLAYSLSMLRESMVVPLSDGQLNRVMPSDIDFVKNFAQTLTFSKIEKLASDINEAQFQLERNANAKILFTNLSLQVSKMLR